MLLSIIIPVYNVEEFIQRCVDSVLQQSFPKSEYEILLINDGSTDKSPAICDEIAKKSENIKVYHKKNGGLSDARNFGIEKSVGKYISFLDSDDYVLKNCYKKMLDVGIENNADIVMGNAINYINEKTQHPKIKKRVRNFSQENGENFLVKSVKSETMSMAAVLGLYKRELIVKNNLKFKKGIYHEDELWTPQVYLKAKNVCYIDLDFYIHVNRVGSITKSENKTKNALDLIKVCYELEKVYQSVTNKKNEKILRNYIAMLYLNAVYIGKLTKKEFKSMLDPSFVLRNSYSYRNKLKAILFNINKDLYYKTNYCIKKLNKDWYKGIARS